MNDFQRLFLVQARSDFAVFEFLQSRKEFPSCHALHYLQMATELFGKARAWKHGRPGNTHRAFVGFLRSLSTNRKAQDQLGYNRKNQKWEQLIRSSVPLAQGIEDLAPALTQDGPNSEYPWPRDMPETAPAEHSFEIWQTLKDTAAGRQFLNLVRNLFTSAEAFL